jgi:hypothetical protein
VIHVGDVSDGNSCPEVITRTYRVTDACGNTAECSQLFTIDDNTAPIISCPPNLTALLDVSEHPAYATYSDFVAAGGIASDNCGLDESSFSLISEVDNGSECPKIVTRTYQIADSCGNTQTCEQIITIDDFDPPTFNSAPMENCVDMLNSVTYTVGSPNPNIYSDDNLILDPSPDYYTFISGDSSLDITGLTDNCCNAANLIINWVIQFTDTPDPLNPTGPALSHPDISGTGQPSTYGNDIYMWGDGVTFGAVTHTITYWVTDCNGNNSPSQTETIIIRPRPELIKVTH